MSKTPVVHAQQRWDYLYFTRKSEPSLYNELCTLGQEGWELVNTHYYKDAKGVMTWLAILKRPSVGASPSSQARVQPSAETEPHPEAAAHEPQGFDLSGDIFDVKKE
ncbi:MAG: hypothetical protein NUV77_03295 [Thermoguttaceae bacterium]|jgi:hypothetical protein|nr:hypothetical protein [Thermoguttaceae bacterium]